MVDENSVNAQPISEWAVKKLKGMCAVSFFACIDAYCYEPGVTRKNLE